MAFVVGVIVGAVIAFVAVLTVPDSWLDTP